MCVYVRVSVRVCGAVCGAVCVVCGAVCGVCVWKLLGLVIVVITSEILEINKLYTTQKELGMELYYINKAPISPKVFFTQLIKGKNLPFVVSFVHPWCLSSIRGVFPLVVFTNITNITFPTPPCQW